MFPIQKHDEGGVRYMMEEGVAMIDYIFFRFERIIFSNLGKTIHSMEHVHRIRLAFN